MTNGKSVSIGEVARFSLNLERTEVPDTDHEYDGLKARLPQVVWRFLSQLANDRPHTLQKILQHYGQYLLPYANQNVNWQHFLAKHYRMFDLQKFVSWQEIKIRLSQQGSNSQLALVYSKAELNRQYDGTLICPYDYERDFVKRLAEDAKIEVLELDQIDAEQKEKTVTKEYWLRLVHLAVAQLQILGVEDSQLFFAKKTRRKYNVNEI
ncbi:MAG: hypothetical protein AAGM67_21335 [Bacteroidota bacterium]